MSAAGGLCEALCEAEQKTIGFGRTEVQQRVLLSFFETAAQNVEVQLVGPRSPLECS